MTQYIIPYPPKSGNHQTGRCGARTFTKPEIVAYRAAVLVACRGVKATHRLKGRVDVYLRSCPPDARARDHDNAEKVIYDALVAAGVIASDSNKVCRCNNWRWMEAGEDGIEAGQVQVIVVNAGGE